MTMGLETSPRYVLFVFYNSFFSYDYLQVKATCQNTSGRDHHHHYDQIRCSVIHDEGEDGGRRRRQGLKTYLRLEPWYVFFFSFLLFLQTFMYRNYSYGHHQHHAQQPQLLPPPSVWCERGWCERGWRERGPNDGVVWTLGLEMWMHLEPLVFRHVQGH